jgi:hypothetical protein
MDVCFFVSIPERQFERCACPHDSRILKFHGQNGLRSRTAAMSVASAELI